MKDLKRMMSRARKERKQLTATRPPGRRLRKKRRRG